VYLKSAARQRRRRCSSRMWVLRSLWSSRSLSLRREWETERVPEALGFISKNPDYIHIIIRMREIEILGRNQDPADAKRAAAWGRDWHSAPVTQRHYDIGCPNIHQM